MFCSEDKDRNSSPWWYLRRCRRTARTRQTTVDWGSEKVNARTSPIASSSDKSAPIPDVERSLHCPSRRLYPFSSNSSTATGKLVGYLGNRLWRRSASVVTCFLPGAANSCPLWRLASDVRQRAPNLNSMTSVVSPCAGSNFHLPAAVVPASINTGFPPRGLLDLTSPVARTVTASLTVPCRCMRYARSGYTAGFLSTTLRSAPVCALRSAGPVKRVAENTAAAIRVAFCMINGTLRPGPVLSLFPLDRAAKCPK